MEILAGVAVDHSTWDDKLTTSDDYADVQCHWPYSSSPSVLYWNCECLGVKTLYFTAYTNNLRVQILGSLDEGVTFPIVIESEFAVLVGTPVLKTINSYLNAIKIQVKPFVAGVHGTLSVIGGGASSPGIDLSVQTAGIHVGNGGMITHNSTSQTITVPPTANSVRLATKGGVTNFAIDSVADASASSPGYLPEECVDYYPVTGGISTLKVYGVTGAYLFYYFLR